MAEPFKEAVQNQDVNYRLINSYNEQINANQYLTQMFATISNKHHLLPITGDWIVHQYAFETRSTL